MTTPVAAAANVPPERTLRPAAIHFAPDAFDAGQRDVVGRRVASSGFLRAAVADAVTPVFGYGNPQHAGVFDEVIGDIQAGTETSWIATNQLERLSSIGVLYRPDPKISDDARLRLRIGPGSYSLCGVFHTTALALPEIAAMFREPVMPWDAVVCPSRSVRETVTRVAEAERDYLRWRLRTNLELAGPTFPIIPLGVDCSKAPPSEREKTDARAQLGVPADAVVALFVGRLSYTLKAHPYATYAALQAVAARTGEPIAFIQCGYFSSKGVEDSFRTGAADFAPDVQAIFADGRDPQIRGACWAAADLFISLADNLQETFGLTPLEAMAAGLPVLATDWDGYRDTVRDGVDGFLVTTWAPAAGAGVSYARALEAGTIPANLFWWATAATASVEMSDLVERLHQLVTNADLRKEMGASGRRRAQTTFDWRQIFRQYEALWAELGERRRSAATSEGDWLRDCPRHTGGQLEPFTAFGHYPSKTVGPQTLVFGVPGADAARYRKLAEHQLFPVAPAPFDHVEGLLARLEASTVATVADVAQALDIEMSAAVLFVAALAKMDLLRLEA